MRLGGGDPPPRDGAGPGEARPQPPPPPPPPPRADTGGFELARGVRISYLSIGIITGAILALGIILFGFGTVEVTEFGLSYSLITRLVEPKAYTSGRYWIGPFNYFIRFPAVVKTIQFSDSKFQGDLGIDEAGDPLLRSRTSDGLDVTVELSFQYQLHQDDVFELYTTLGAGRDFHDTFVRVSIDRLTEIATQYTANEFFTDRTRIGKAMEEKLREDFESRLFSTVFSFQLRAVGLPDEFEKAIQLTEVKKQDVHVAEAEMNSTSVGLETQLMQATRRTQVRGNKADAIAQSVMLANAADIEQFVASQEKAADSYSEVLEKLDSKEADLLSYVQSRVLRDHASDKTTLGLSLPTVVGMV